MEVLCLAGPVYISRYNDNMHARVLLFNTAPSYSVNVCDYSVSARASASRNQMRQQLRLVLHGIRPLINGRNTS